MSCRSRVMKSSRRILHAHALSNWSAHVQQVCLSYVRLPWQPDRLHCVLAHTGLMVAQKPHVENIQTEHGCRFQEEKETVPGHMVALNLLVFFSFFFVCHVVFLLAITHPESPSVLFSMSRLSLISYTYKNMDTKLSTRVAGIRFLLRRSTTIPFRRHLSVFANWKFYHLLIKSSSCTTSLLFTRSPCTARLCELTARPYCFPIPWKAQQAAGSWPNDTDACQHT